MIAGSGRRAPRLPWRAWGAARPRRAADAALVAGCRSNACLSWLVGIRSPSGLNQAAAPRAIAGSSSGADLGSIPWWRSIQAIQLSAWGAPPSRWVRRLADAPVTGVRRQRRARDRAVHRIAGQDRAHLRWDREIRLVGGSPHRSRAPPDARSHASRRGTSASKSSARRRPAGMRSEAMGQPPRQAPFTKARRFPQPHQGEAFLKGVQGGPERPRARQGVRSRWAELHPFARTCERPAVAGRALARRGGGARPPPSKLRPCPGRCPPGPTASAARHRVSAGRCCAR